NCIVTNEGAQCKTKTCPEWLIPAADKSPTYTRAYTHKQGSATSAGQSVILFPMQTEIDRSLDEYIGLVMEACIALLLVMTRLTLRNCENGVCDKKVEKKCSRLHD
ncbi:hypothetical protein INT46_006617, partial [Mucor plumbeus]